MLIPAFRCAPRWALFLRLLRKLKARVTHQITMSLTNESIAVVTGAASGIGRALAVRLAQEGINGLAISDVNAEGLNETARMIERANVRVSTHVVNVADLDQMRAFVADVVAAH